MQIATNGSIMPSPEMLKLIKDNNITIRISDYSIVHQQAQVLKKKCEEMAIPCFYHEFAANNAMWYFCGDKDMSRDPDNRRVKKKFNECKLHSCLTLERGELSYCSRAANSYVIQKFTRQEKDFVKVEDTQSFAKELCNYITFRHPMEACRYCNGSEEKYLVAPAIQLKEEDGKTEERGV